MRLARQSEDNERKRVVENSPPPTPPQPEVVSLHVSNHEPLEEDDPELQDFFDLECPSPEIFLDDCDDLLSSISVIDLESPSPV